MVFKNIQLKFCLSNDPLFKYEDSRPWKLEEKADTESAISQYYFNRNPSYLIDIDFGNIKSLTY